MDITRKSLVEESQFTPFLKRLTIFSAGGPWLDGFVLTIIGIALIQLGPQLNLNAYWTGIIGAAALVGLFVGGAVFGYLTDLYGRVLMYEIDLVAILIFSIMQIFVTEGWQLAVLRFLIGIAIGADYPIATSLLAEFSPKKYRGQMLGILVVIWYVGAVCAAIVGWYGLQIGPSGWKWMLAFAALPSAILLIGRWGTPESPRWLLKAGRIEEARAVVKKVWGPEADLVDLGEVEAVKTRFWKIVDKEYITRTMFVGLFWLFLVVPIFAIYTFGPALLDAFHLSKGNQWIIGYMIIDVMFLVGCIPPLYTVNTMGRRKTIIWSFFFMTVGLLILGIWPNSNVIIVIVAFSIYAFFSGGPNTLCWIYPNELFPTDIRASAVGVGTAISRIGAAVGTYLLPLGLAKYSVGPIMLVGAAMTFLGFLVCLAWAPETKGLSLAEASSISTNDN